MSDTKTILLVDDHAVTTLARAQFLAQIGYCVVTAASGEEAVETLFSGKDIDLILMDIDLGPGMDGTRAAELILARRDIPILFLSNHTEKHIVDKTRSISSYGYVVKESGDTVLLASIDTAFRLYYAGMDLIARRNELHASRNELERLNRKIESLIETIPNPVFYKDAELKYMGCNRAFEELTGKNRHEISGKTVFQLYEYELAKKYDEKDRDLLQTKGSQYYEGRMKNSFGRYRDVMFSKSVFEGLGGRVEGMVGVITDITDIKQAEAAMASAIEENRTLYMELQHRVKNTMNIITGIINIECDSLKHSPALKSLESIRNRVFTLAELYSLLYVSGNAKLVRLDRYLENIVKSLDLTLVKNSGMVITTRCASVEADVRVATSAGLALNELVTNACKYSRPGVPGGWIEVRLRSHEQNLILEVEDNGMGLPGDFDISRTSGLGLQLVKGLVKQHRGTIDVMRQNTTLFRITVPENGK